MSEFMTPPKHVNFRAKKILLSDEEVIIHKDKAFLVEGRIPHSCWNNIEGVTEMIGITVI